MRPGIGDTSGREEAQEARTRRKLHFGNSGEEVEGGSDCRLRACGGVKSLGILRDCRFRGSAQGEVIEFVDVARSGLGALGRG